ncbi:hypothetical protein ACFX13_035256 [Malus domestica]
MGSRRVDVVLEILVLLDSSFHFEAKLSDFNPQTGSRSITISRCLPQIGSALIIDDSAFTEDSANPIADKDASQSVVWTKENEDGALENFKSQKRERYELAEDCADDDEANYMVGFFTKCMKII